MRILLFGATGMVGQGVLRECVLDPRVTLVQTIGRSVSEVSNSKLHELVHANLFDLQSIEPALTGFDACFFCLGVSSAGKKADEYRHLTYDLTMSAANTLSRLSPQMTFVYVSGAGTDSSEQGSSMWARVKGETENALLRLFKQAYMFRPGFIAPVNGERSKTKAYRVLYALVSPLTPLLRALLPNLILTTEQVGRAMIAAAAYGAPKRVLESSDIRALAMPVIDIKS